MPLKQVRFWLCLLLVLCCGAVSAQTPTAPFLSFSSGAAHGIGASDRSTSLVGESAAGPSQASSLGFGPLAWVLIRSPLMGKLAGTTNGFSGDGGPATAAQFRRPYSVAVDAAGHAYICDSDNGRIRKVDAVTGVISTIAGDPSGFVGDVGPATDIRLWQPKSVATDAAGNIYIADARYHRVRRIDASTGVISTIAGSGTIGDDGDGGLATLARFNEPEGVHVDAEGHVYITANRYHRVRKIDRLTGIISNYAGTPGQAGSSGDGGQATSAKLNWPNSVWLDNPTGDLYIADTNNNLIRKVDASGVISKVAGGTSSFVDGVVATATKVNRPNGVLVDAAGYLYISDTLHRRVRKVDPATQIIETVAGNGSVGVGGDGDAAIEAQMDQPFEIAIDRWGHILAADWAKDRVRRITWEAEPFESAGSDGRVLATAVVAPGDDLVLQVDDADLTGPSVDVDVRNLNTGEFEIATLLGGGGTYSLTLPTAAVSGSPVDDDGTLEIAAGHQVNIWYTDAAAETRIAGANLLVTPTVVNLLGDVDGNGTVEVEDVIDILNHSIGVGQPVKEEALLKANVSANGIYDGFEPTMADAIAMLQLIDGTITQLPVLDAGSANHPPHTGVSPKSVAPVLAERQAALHIQGDMVRVWVDDRAGIVSGQLRLTDARGQVLLRPDMAGYVHGYGATDEGLRVAFVGSGKIEGPGALLEFRAPAGLAGDVALAEVVFNEGAAPVAIGPTIVVPEAFALEGNYPNPFNPSTTIRFALPEAGRVRLEVFDVLGQKIATLADGDWPTGFHRIEWNGRDQSGRSAGSGVYFYRLEATAPERGAGGPAARFVETRRMLLLK